ncbi:MAG: FG-GAP repeat domain-containing protein [Thermomicrobiales bacterium]
MTYRGNRIVVWIICLRLAGGVTIHAAPSPVTTAVPVTLQSTGSPPPSGILPFEDPFDFPDLPSFPDDEILDDPFDSLPGQPSFDNPELFVSPIPTDDTGLVMLYILTSFMNPGLYPKSLPFDDPVPLPPPSPYRSNVGTSAAAPRVTAAGLSTPRLVAARGPLRAGSRLRDHIAIAVAARTVYVYLNRGDGTVLTPTSVYINVVNAVSTAVAIGDVTGDGKPDLIVADAGNNAVIVLPGNGDGTFGAPVSYSLGATAVSPGSIALADLNGDGKLDIVTGNIGSVTVLLNNGSGAFPSAVTYAAPVTATCSSGCGAAVKLGDLNGDGKPDIATTTTLAPDATQIAVLLNHGDGTFAAATLYTVGSGPVAIAIGDVNGDGKPDLAVANYYDSTVSILLNTGTGAFATQVSYPVGANPKAITLADKNRDGILDLVTADRTGSIMILHGKGDGTFPRTTLPVGVQPQDVVAPVLTASGRRDLVVTNGSDHTVSILLNNGNGTFVPAPGSPIALPCRPVGLAAADFTGDSKMDLAVACLDAAPRILTGNGTGGFTVGAPLPASGSYLVAADLGNGHPDLVVYGPDINSGGGNVYVLLNNGFGTFTGAAGSPLAPGKSTTPASLAVADINGDNKPDLLVGLDPTNVTGATIAVLIGHGDGTFTVAPGSPIAAGTAPPSLAVADVNGDNKPDLMTLTSPTSSTTATTVSVRLGQGDGTFGAPTALPDPLGGAASNFFSGLTVADLDGDGALDIAVTDRCAGVGCTALFKGKGDGTFTTAGLYGTGQGTLTDSQSNALRAADLSGSGYPDLVAPVSTGGFTPAGFVSVIRNRFVPPSAATHLIFSAPMPTTLAAGKPFAVAVAAADASGKLVTGFGGAITLSLNGGSGLGGTLTRTANVGSAVYLGLSIANRGTGLTLTATSGGLTGTSTVFGVGPPSPLPPPQPTAPVQPNPPPLPPLRPTVPVALPTPNPLPPSRP